MAKSSKKIAIINDNNPIIGYDIVLSDVIDLLESARRASVRTVNAIITSIYWEIGRRIVEFEQGGKRRAEYGKELLKRLSVDLTARFGRGFSERNLEQMRLFYLGWPISQIVSAKSNDTANQDYGLLSEKSQTMSADFEKNILLRRFQLPWSHYVRLLSVNNSEARSF
ncbi:MAG: DUF1016 N-terminal domain-containing protein [Candidatus Methanoperedens sp.]|nr:DUF1016 N-terminal domain-containing protein [Candidatus Methanoperedens sp.]